MRIAVTGSHGFIGSALVASLEADGHAVVRVGRDGVVPDALRGCDGVVHLAGEPMAPKRWTPERKQRILHSRSDMTSRLATVLASLDTDERPRVLVSGSAIGYYGDHGDEILREDTPPGDDFPAEVCVAWEAATAPAAEAGIRVARIRTGLVLGRGGGALDKMLLLFRLGLGGRFGSGRQWWSWIALDDEIGAIRYLLDQDVSGPVNLTAPAPVTNADFTRSLGKALHRPAVIPVPRFGPRLLMGRELADSLLWTSQRVEPTVLTKTGYEFRFPDLTEALRAVVA